MRRAAEALGLRVFTPERLKPFVEEASALRPGAFVVASYGKILPQALLDLVPIAFNVHPSLLPLYRGATPLQSALRDGRAETGVTIIAMDRGMDTGDVLVQVRVPIEAGETYGALHDRTAALGATLVAAAIDAYENGTLAREPQRDAARRLGIGEDEIAATSTRPWSKDDWVLDPRARAGALDALVRALSPDPGARLSVPELGTVAVLAAHRDEGPAFADPHPTDDVAPGALVRSSQRLWLRAADGWLELERVRPPGRNAMTAREFLSGYGRYVRDAPAQPAPR